MTQRQLATAPAPAAGRRLTAAGPASQSLPERVLALQRSAGNSAVLALLGRGAGDASQGVRTLARCGSGPCSCGSCRPDPEVEEELEWFGRPAPRPSTERALARCTRKPSARVLARMPAYRPSPPWSTRDPSQAADACQPLPRGLAEDKWRFWSTAFPMEAARRANCPELETVWDAYFAATGTPRFVWDETAHAQSCIIRSLKNDDDHIPHEDAIMGRVRAAMPTLLRHLRGRTTARLTFAQVGISGSLLTPDLNLNNNTRAGGQLFGGVGRSEYGPDTRNVDGYVELTKEVDPGNRLWVGVRPYFHFRWHITDGVDFCPGNTGERAHWVVRLPVWNLSLLEASGMARDIYVEATYTRNRYDAPYGPFPNPDLIDPDPPRIVTVPAQALFDYDSDRLRPEAAEALLRTLGDRPRRADPSRLVDVRGHTDARGSEGYNQRLSERRAEAVRDLLETQYPNLRGRIRAVGFGESQPVAPNEINGRDNPAGRAANRRVEIEFGAVENP